MNFRVCVLVLFLLLLSACGGGSGGGNNVEEPEVQDTSLSAETANRDNQQAESNSSPLLESPVESQVVAPKRYVTISEFNAESAHQETATHDEVSQEVFKNAHYDYAFNFYERFNHRNFSFSPFDTQYLLANLSLGAGGATYEKISEASNLDLDQESTHVIFNEWRRYLNGLEGVSLSHFFWGQESYMFSREYLQKQYDYYASLVEKLDFLNMTSFSSQNILENFNASFNRSGIDSRTRIVTEQYQQVELLWSDHLSVSSFKGRFHGLEEEEPVLVDMVQVDGLMKSYYGDNFKVIEIPFRGGELALLVTIPDQEQFEDVLENVDADFFEEAIYGLSEAEETITLPYFEIREGLFAHDLSPATVDPGENALAQSDTSIDLNSEFLMPVAYMDEAANFSKINVYGYLYIKPPQYHSSISISETGLTSSSNHFIEYQASELEDPRAFDYSSSSFVVMSEGRFPQTKPCFAYSDQTPFLFTLYSKTKGIIVNAGHLVDMEGEGIEPDWLSPYAIPCGESPPIEIYKHRGGIQCESPGVDLDTMQAELEEAGVEVLDGEYGHDGLFRIQVCGVGTGDILIYTIYEHELSLAEALGFNRLDIE